MELDYRKRPQSMSEFRNLVLNSVHKSHVTDQPLPSDTLGDNSQHASKIVGKVIILDGARKGTSITVADRQTVKIGRSVIQSD